MQDRVTYGMSRRISDGNYGSIEAHFEYSTDVLKDETIETAMKRCVHHVEKNTLKKIKEFKEDLGV